MGSGSNETEEENENDLSGVNLRDSINKTFQNAMCTNKSLFLINHRILRDFGTHTFIEFWATNICYYLALDIKHVLSINHSENITKLKSFSLIGLLNG